VFLINETGRTGPQTLTLTAKRPDGSVIFSVKKSVEAAGGDTYGQLLAAGITIPEADAAGMFTLEGTLVPQDSKWTSLQQTNQVEVIDVAGAAPVQNVAVLEPGQEVDQTLRDVFHVTPAKFSIDDTTNHFDAIVLASKFNHQDLDAAASLKTSSEISKEVFKA